MLRDGTLTYQTAVEALKSAEIVMGQTQAMGGVVPTIPAPPDQVQYETVNKVGRKDVDQIKDCQYCGGDHPRRKCPAYNEVCHKCKEKGHFAKKCTTDPKRCGHCGEKTVNSVALGPIDGHDSIDDDLVYLTIT